MIHKSMCEAMTQECAALTYESVASVKLSSVIMDVLFDGVKW